MSIRSNLTDLNTALDNMPEANRTKAIEMIAAVVQIGLKTAGMPQELSDAMESLVTAAITRTALHGQINVLNEIRSHMPFLPHVKAIAALAGIA